MNIGNFVRTAISASKLTPNYVIENFLTGRAATATGLTGGQLRSVSRRWKNRRVVAGNLGTSSPSHRYRPVGGGAGRPES